MYCGQCGKKVIENANFCSYCGNKIEKIAKQNTFVDDISMQMMVAASDAIGKITVFNDVDDRHSMAVNMAYFYAFLKFHLTSITDMATSMAIVDNSIRHFENATKDNPFLATLGETIRWVEKNTFENINYTMKTFPQNPFMGMTVFYLKDLYNSNTLDISKVDVAEKNIQSLYGITSNLTKNVKISR